MKKNALILFFKYPEFGKVKTRLAKELGENFTLTLYKQFLYDIFMTSNQLNVDVHIALTTNGNLEAIDFMQQRSSSIFQQQGKNLGERMHNAFAKIFSQNYAKCVLIGSDSPDISKNIITKSYTHLEAYDIVLGPTYDGGYYLIAGSSHSLDKKLFENITWSRETVLDETLRNITTCNKSYVLLKKWLDIDDIDDLTKFYMKNIKKGKISNTMDFLINNREHWYGRI